MSLNSPCVPVFMCVRQQCGFWLHDKIWMYWLGRKFVVFFSSFSVANIAWARHDSIQWSFALFLCYFRMSIVFGGGVGAVVVIYWALNALRCLCFVFTKRSNCSRDEKWSFAKQMNRYCYLILSLTSIYWQTHWWLSSCYRMIAIYMYDTSAYCTPKHTRTRTQQTM